MMSFLILNVQQSGCVVKISNKIRGSLKTASDQWENSSTARGFSPTKRFMGYEVVCVFALTLSSFVGFFAYPLFLRNKGRMHLLLIFIVLTVLRISLIKQHPKNPAMTMLFSFSEKLTAEATVYFCGGNHTKLRLQKYYFAEGIIYYFSLFSAWLWLFLLCVESSAPHQ